MNTFCSLHFFYVAYSWLYKCFYFGSPRGALTGFLSHLCCLKHANEYLLFSKYLLFVAYCWLFWAFYILGNPRAPLLNNCPIHVTFSMKMDVFYTLEVFDYLLIFAYLEPFLFRVFESPLSVSPRALSALLQNFYPVYVTFATWPYIRDEHRKKISIMKICYHYHYRTANIDIIETFYFNDKIIKLFRKYKDKTYLNATLFSLLVVFTLRNTYIFDKFVFSRRILIQRPLA